MRYFYSSFIFMAGGLIAAYYIEGIKAVYLTLLLITLEVSLSFDNAIVNAKVLSQMDAVWQKRFIVFGLIIAVFGMRLLFPLLVVYFTSHMGILQTLDTALHHQKEYATVLQSAQPDILAFGGAFLLMVFLDFFLQTEKVPWIAVLEDSKLVKKLSQISNIKLIIASLVLLAVWGETNNLHVMFSFIYGTLFFSALEAITSYLSFNMPKNGLPGFIYLEVLDASFSFDGVIGAFAISGNILIIMLGLGIGAMFVRSITIYFVQRQTLTRYIYLEHGAHYAIGVLAVLMLLKLSIHISDTLTGTIGVCLIGAAFAHSLIKNKNTINEV